MGLNDLEYYDTKEEAPSECPVCDASDFRSGNTVERNTTIYEIMKCPACQYKYAVKVGT